MREVKVSVIMPFYNGAEYINETMMAILDQTLEEIEIICVDDGSTDQTFMLLQEYAKKDERITVLQQKKANAGVARNLGMKKANGEYLLFLDSDDLFEKDMLEKMYAACKDCQADVCVCDADQYDILQEKYIEKPQYLRKKVLPDQIPFSRKTIGKYILYFTTSVPWNKMIKKSFVDEHGIEFQDISRANDQYFSIMTLLLAKKITVVNEKLVHYKVKQKENLTTKFSETPLCAYESMLAVKNTLENMNLLKELEIRCAFDNKILNLMLYSLNIQSTIDGYKVLYETLKDGGFENLGFIFHDSSYYFNELEYQNLNHILEGSYDEYLLLKNREYRNTIEEKKAAYKEMVMKKNATIAGLKEKERELNAIKKKNWYQKITGLIDWYHKVLKRNKDKA